MRRLYVAPVAVAMQNNHMFHPRVGWQAIHLIAYTSPANAELMHSDPAAWEALPEVLAWRATESQILISTSLEHSEASEDAWHSHPDVAILPHPTFEGTDKLSKHKDSVPKKLKQKHLDALSVIGVTPNDTVWDVSDKAKVLNINVRLRAVL